MPCLAQINSDCTNSTCEYRIPSVWIPFFFFFALWFLSFVFLCPANTHAFQILYALGNTNLGYTLWNENCTHRASHGLFHCIVLLVSGFLAFVLIYIYIFPFRLFRFSKMPLEICLCVCPSLSLFRFDLNFCFLFRFRS